MSEVKLESMEEETTDVSITTVSEPPARVPGMTGSPAMSAQELERIARRYAGLEPEKRAAFRKKAAQLGISYRNFPVVPIASRERRLPLTYAQERLWFLWKLDPASPAYNITRAVRLEGTLDVQAVREGVSALVLRHASLRTRFEECDGVAAQIVDAAGEYVWAEYDLSALPEATRDAEQRKRLAQLSVEPFDLERGELLRVALLTVGHGRYVLHFAVHHIVADGGSLGLLTQEFGRAYDAMCSGRPIDLEALPAQYADYALWQREWLDGEALEGQLAYWRKQLGSSDAVLELPGKKLSAGLRSARGGRIGKIVPASLAVQLRQLARRHRVTLPTLLNAAYCLLLSRYAGQRDVRVGVPVAGRNRAGTEQLIGFFVNTLVLRADLGTVDTLRELLAQIDRSMAEAQSHQDLPFARLVDALRPERSLGETPLFQAMFNYSTESIQALALPGLTISPVREDAETARFDLVLNVVDSEELDVAFNYALDRFERATVERLLAHYLEVLAQFGCADELDLGAVALSVDRRWKDVRSEHEFTPVMNRISERASQMGEARAVVCEDESLSYAKLEAWSNRIGRRLKTLGVRAA
ncbi:condensation domain-containing protein, partial [Paraburkholderia tropica]|uniref:condensation domain-containing protein n=1 Tax=Paraburkholderia tropica TaxID=92647 RepID=UPI000B13F490